MTCGKCDASSSDLQAGRCAALKFWVSTELLRMLLQLVWILTYTALQY